MGYQNLLVSRYDANQHDNNYAKNDNESKMNTFVRAVLEVLSQEHLGHGYQLHLDLNLFCNVFAMLCSVLQGFALFCNDLLLFIFAHYHYHLLTSLS